MLTGPAMRNVLAAIWQKTDFCDDAFARFSQYYPECGENRQ